MIKIKIMGERSTGTNLLEKILTKNLHCEIHKSSSGLLPSQIDAMPGRFEGRWSSRRATKEAIQDHNHYKEVSENGGWKHAAVTQRFLEEFARPKSTVVVCIVRHPSEWLRSMHRNPFHGIGHVPRKFSDFIRSPWVASARDELGERLISTPLMMLERKAVSYTQLKKQHSKTLIVRYEDIVLDAENALSELTIWNAQWNEKIDLPSGSARSFGRGNLKTAEYIKKARSSSYQTLENEDRKYVLDQLSGGTLLELYPT